MRPGVVYKTLESKILVVRCWPEDSLLELAGLRIDHERDCENDSRKPHDSNKYLTEVGNVRASKHPSCLQTVMSVSILLQIQDMRTLSWQKTT